MKVKWLSLLVVMAFLAGLKAKVVHGRQLGVISNLMIETEVDRRYAITHVISRMKNPSNVSQELVFKMKLPKTAFVSSLIMEIEGRNYSSSVQEKEKAKKTYEKAKSRGKSTGLVEQSLKNFQVSANVEAHQKVTFYLKYEELMQRVKGVYNLTINVKPGQEVEELVVKVSIKETERLKKIFLQETPGKEITSPTPVDWKTTHIKGVSPLSIEWVSRNEVKLLYHRDNGRSKGVGAVSDGVLSMSYDLARKPDGGEVEIQDNFFVHYFSPEGLPLLPKHTIFVIDISGSMSGNYKLEYVKKAMNAILKDMKKKDTFEVITFSDSVRSLGVFEGKRKAVKKSLKKVNNLGPQGGTNINQALLEAIYNLRQINRNSTAKQIVFLTDGSPTVGVTNLDTIRKNVRAANEDRLSIFSLAFGKGADLNFLRQISADNQGFARQIYEHSSPLEQLTGFYDTISRPLLTNVNIAYDNETVESESLVRPSLQTYYGGDEFVVTGKLLPNVTYVEPDVTGYGENDQVQLDVSRTELHSSSAERENMIERLWAYMTVQNLIEKMDVEDDVTKKEEMKSKALQIALEYNFVTKLTSLVVVRPEDLEEDFEEEEAEDDENISNDISQNTGSSFYALPTGRFRTGAMSGSSKSARLYHSPRQASVDRDPHFMVYAKNSHVPYCFDFHGQSGDVLSLVRDSTSGIVINGLVTSSLSKNGKTFFTKLFLSMGKVNITFTPLDLKVDCPSTNESLWFEEGSGPVTLSQVNVRASHPQKTTEDFSDKEKSGRDVQSAETKIHPDKCNRSLSWEEVDGTWFLDVHLELWNKNKFVVVLGDTLARFVVTRAKSKKKQDYLGFYIDKQDVLSPDTKGILGQFKHKLVFTDGSTNETPDLDGNIQSPLLSTTQEGTVKTRLVKTYDSRRLSGLIREKIPCLFVRNLGKGLLTGSPEDYILPCLRC